MSTEKEGRPTWLELERVHPMPVVCELTSLSPDTVTRRHKDKLVYLSPRRKGMKLKDILRINNGE